MTTRELPSKPYVATRPNWAARTRSLNYLAALVCIASLMASYWLSYTPLIIPVMYVFFSIMAILFYAKDKYAAQRGTQRTPENTLHVLGLLGGWPGAIAAQQTFRHKTRKLGFRIPFWITVVLNYGAFVWIHMPTGAALFNTWLFEAESVVVEQMSSGTARSIVLRLLSFHA